MSNENLGENTPPVNDKTDVVAKIFSTVPDDVGQIKQMLRQIIDFYTDRAALEKRQAYDAARANPPTIAPAVTASKPPRRATPVDHTEENTAALQAFVALEMQSNKFPSMSAVCKLSKIGRGIMYKPDRLLQFKEIYRRKEEEHKKRRKTTAVREVRQGFRRDVNSGGGLEAIDYDESEE